MGEFRDIKDLRQEQIDNLENRIDDLEKEPEKAIADKIDQVNYHLGRVTKRYETTPGRRSMYQKLTLMKEALERDGYLWLDIEKERLLEQKNIAEKMKANSDEYEKWLTNDGDGGDEREGDEREGDEGDGDKGDGDEIIKN